MSLCSRIIMLKVYQLALWRVKFSCNCENGTLKHFPLYLVMHTHASSVTLSLSLSHTHTRLRTMYTLTGVPFPRTFIPICKKILTRLYRVFVHVYIHHFDKVVEIGAVSVVFFFRHFGSCALPLSLPPPSLSPSIRKPTWTLATNTFTTLSKSLI